MIDDRMRRLATHAADAMAATELVFVEDDDLDALAARLQDFLTAAGLSLAEPATGGDLGDDA